MNPIIQFIKFIGKVLNAIFSVVVAVLKTVFADLPKNVVMYFKMATNKEEREKITRKLEMEKKQELMDDRLGRVERLVYAVYNDPAYAKRKEGEYDIKKLKGEIDK
ncbi:MAG: hypothetical protein V1906_01570 [Candidatus Woesearchaeota archaeon]